MVDEIKALRVWMERNKDLISILEFKMMELAMLLGRGEEIKDILHIEIMDNSKLFLSIKFRKAKLLVYNISFQIFLLKYIIAVG